MKTLTGQEASLLALLAQSIGSDISQEEINNILLKISSLNKDAYLIGKAIIGIEDKKIKEKHFKAAYGFVDWVMKMRESNPKNKSKK